MMQESTQLQPNMGRGRGFSLLEVLYATFLTATCGIILATTMPIATNSRERAHMNDRATSLAQKELEGVRGLGYPNLVASQLFTNKLIDSATPLSTTVAKPGTNPVYASATYSFTNVDDASADSPARVLADGVGTVKIEDLSSDLRRITVVLTYTDRGKTRTISMGTVVANL